MKNFVCVVMTIGLMLLSSFLNAQEASAIVKVTGIKSGLGLVVGSKSLTVAKRIAQESELYLQVLAKDLVQHQAFGLEVVNSPEREKLGIRLSPFNSEHYGSLLFNLIVVENIVNVKNVSVDEWNRLLVPKGLLVMRDEPKGFSEKAQKIGFQEITIPGWKCAYRRGPCKVKWDVIDSIKWRAGARAHWSIAWKALSFGSGKFLYVQLMEVPNNHLNANMVLWVRDAYNGRNLWHKKIGETVDRRGGIGAAAISNDDVVMVVLTENKLKKLVCLDARTGKLLSEPQTSKKLFASKIRSIRFAENKFITYGQGYIHVYDHLGKSLWEGRSSRTFRINEGRIFQYNGKGLSVKTLSDGKIIWQVSHATPWAYQMLLTKNYVHITHKETAATFSMKDGKKISFFKTVRKGSYQSKYKVLKDELYYCRYTPYPKRGESDFLWSKIDPLTGKPSGEEKQSGTAYKANMCAPVIHGIGDYFVYFFNVWMSPETSKREYTYLAHPSCAIGTRFANNMAYNTPSRKSGPLQGISASCAADISFDHNPGGKIHQVFSEKISQKTNSVDADWTMYRKNLARGNATGHTIGSSLKLAWMKKIGLGGRTYGELNEQRLGLTQPVSAWGVVIVADIPSQRIVALDQKTGKEKWMLHVGARVDFSPALYKGLCLFTSKDGWVWCLDALTGKVRWRLLMPSKERLIGGQDKLESLWPIVSDVFVDKQGVAYVSCGLDTRTLGGLRAMAFDAVTGKIVWKKCYSGKLTNNPFRYVGADIFSQGADANYIYMGPFRVEAKTGVLAHKKRKPAFILQGVQIDDFLAGGISIPRNVSDRAPVKLSSGIARGKTISFTKQLSVAYNGGSSLPDVWAFKGEFTFFARTQKGKAPNLWDVKGNQLIMDSILLAKDLVYVAGHYYKIKGEPELRVYSAKDGTLLSKQPLGGFASWDGMSLSGDSLLISTRQGKLLCFKSE